MVNSLSRLELQIGVNSVEKLKNSTVMIIGVGGVGSYAVEALARSGIGRLIIVDKADVILTDMNRQIHAFPSTIGQSKVQLMKDRILDINPKCEVTPLQMNLDEDTVESIFDFQADYIVDAIDTISNKILLITESKKRNIPIICSMGAGNRLDPSQFQVADISKTTMDPIAKVLRHELKKRGITKGVKVVFSPVKPLIPKEELYAEIGDPDSEIRKEQRPPSSNGFVSPSVGLILASVVVRDIIGM